MIRVSQSNLHWNYCIALENDMEQLSRYIEFCQDNFEVYSIELAHLLFAASSDIDVVAKAFCEIISPNSLQYNIDDYRNIIVPLIPDFSSEQVFVPKYGLTLKPWLNWNNGTNPDWWQSYNRVKHKRHQFFQEATLHNSLNALAGLFIITLYYYRALINQTNPINEFKEVTRVLQPDSTLMKLKNDYYYAILIDG